MLKSSRVFLGLAAAALLLFVTGCGPAQKNAAKKPDAQDHEHDHDHGHEGHDHAAKGPNGGQILEVGEEEYHVEWINDEKADKVAFVVLDSAMKKEVPIEQPELTVAVTMEGKTKEYKVPAAKGAGDKPSASRFEIIDKSLLTDLSIGEGVEAKLLVTIAGKPYTVKIEAGGHDHDHDHGHDHDKEKK